MDNYWLLEKYRKKFSVFFALFVLFSFWIIQAIFLTFEYLPHNAWVEKVLEKKFSWVANILKNYEAYLEKINNKDRTLWKILIKTLENVIVYENCVAWICEETLINNIDDGTDFSNSTDKQQFYDSWEYKYLKKSFLFDGIEYKVIIKTYNEYAFSKIFSFYLYFLLFSIPFALWFYFLWYYFVGKNFRPIRETISSLEDFTANINHEIKTPITEIVSSLSLSKKTKKYEDAIDQSLTSFKKLTKILDSILWIVQIVDSTYKKQKFDLLKEIKNIIKDNSKKIAKKQIVIKTNFPDKSYFLKLNKEHFEICVWNILKNAIKYSNKEWIIEIYFKEWLLEIKDYWIWISKVNLKNIYNRYFRENYTKEEWYWLWLALVKKIVDINSWKIIIKSQKRKTVSWTKWTRVKILFDIKNI